jgi:integrase
LLAAVKASDYPYLNVITLIAITTGARRGEIFGLRWRDIDLTARRAVLHKTKNSERRSLTLVGPVVDELKKHRKIRSLTNDYLFMPNGGRSFEFRNAWNKALQDAEITDFRFHDLRHCCASYLAMNGATTAEIAAVLGHKTLAMVKRYSHLSDEHVRDVVERTARKVLGK